MKIRKLLFISLLFVSVVSQAGIISGTVYDENGETLPGATIYVVELKSGTASNADGYYELNLEPGLYTIIFRFIGFKTFSQRVNLANQKVTLDVHLEPQAVILKDLEIRAGTEDAAYSIIRKAIAKSGYYRNIVDQYHSTVYMKGLGNMNSVPFFLKKRLKEEGIDPSRYFVSESVSEVSFSRPNNYEERVVSVRSTGDDDNSSPNNYITASFYEPEIAEVISPLNPKAFSFYRFEYLGSFVDQGHEVNRVKVIAKSTGDHLFNGVISIVEGDWSIHSLTLATSKLGIGIKVEQLYQEFENLAWLPVTHKFNVDGKVIGIGFTYDYLASVTYTEVKINEELIPVLEVVDDKIEKEKSKSLKSAEITLNKINSGVLEQEITRKELKKQMKAYEKDEQLQKEEPDVLITRAYSMDSLAYKRDTSYWNRIRPMPLSKVEIIGYHQVDSIAGNLEKDTTEKGRKARRFSPLHLVGGHNYRLNKYSTIYINDAIQGLAYNTVEGLVLDYSFGYRYRKVKNADDPTKKNITQYANFKTNLRYSLARNKLLPYYSLDAYSRLRPKRFGVTLGGGSTIYQYNSDDPVHPLLNSLYTLFMEENLFKLYQSDELQATLSRTFSGKLTIDASMGYQYRSRLENLSSIKIINWDNKEFTDNNPTNYFQPDTSFPNNGQSYFELKFTTRPWVKYRIRNGSKIAMRSSSPTVVFTIRKAIPGIAGSLADYTRQEVKLIHDFELSPIGMLNFETSFASFLQNDQSYFMDQIHFRGNQTIISPGNEFRQLNYYRFSSDKYAFSVNTNLKFKNNFFLPRLPFLGRKGIKDFVVANYLNVKGINGYVELGYGLDYVFKFMRIEAVTSFLDGKYDGFGIKIGLPPDININ